MIPVLSSCRSPKSGLAIALQTNKVHFVHGAPKSHSHIQDAICLNHSKPLKWQQCSCTCLHESCTAQHEKTARVMAAASSTNGSTGSVSRLDPAEPVFDNGRKTPLVNNLQAYGLPEEDWSTASLSFVVVGASGGTPCFSPPTSTVYGAQLWQSELRDSRDSGEGRRHIKGGESLRFSPRNQVVTPGDLSVSIFQAGQCDPIPGSIWKHTIHYNAATCWFPSETAV